jgi:hypothetical protein
MKKLTEPNVAEAAAGLSTEAQVRARNNLSRTTLHRLEKRGVGPRWTRIGSRKYLTPEAERAWLASIDGRAIDMHEERVAA